MDNFILNQISLLSLPLQLNRKKKRIRRVEDEINEKDIMVLQALIELGGEAPTPSIQYAVNMSSSRTIFYLRRLENFKKVVSREVKIKESLIRSKKLIWTVA